MATAIYCCSSCVCSSAMNYITRLLTTTDSNTLALLSVFLFPRTVKGTLLRLVKGLVKQRGEQGASKLEAPCYASLRIALPIVS